MTRIVFTLLCLTSLGTAPLFGQAVDWRKLTQALFEKTPVADIGLPPLLPQGGVTKEAWPDLRKKIEAGWRERLGTGPKKAEKLDVNIEETVQVDGYTRQKLSFATTDGSRIAAYLLIPGDLKKDEKRPAVVVFHQTTGDTMNEPVGLGKMPNHRLALGVHLVQRGYVVLCPECWIMRDGGPGKQAALGDKLWPGWTGMDKMTFDASRCIDFLETLPMVDATRVGCIGHSLGAKETLFALAFEPRFQVGVFNEGGIGLRMSNWTAPWYLTAKMKDQIPAFENHQVLALCAPRPILILGGDSADGDKSWTFVKAALPVYELLGAGDRIGLINHHGQHTFPREARRTAYRWLDHWLRFTPSKDEVGP